MKASHKEESCTTGKKEKNIALKFGKMPDVALVRETWLNF